MRRLNTGRVVFSAGAVFLGCSLLLACGLVSLTVINLLNPNPQNVPTRPVQSTTLTPAGTVTVRGNATRAPNSNGTIPTLLPTLPPPQVSTAVITSGSPVQAVREYYRLVSQKQLATSWTLLSDDFKRIFICCAPDYDYQGYLDWWNTVDQVEFGEIRTVSENNGRAVVYAELRYRMNAGGVSNDSEPYIELVYDAERAAWLFDDKGPTQTGRR